MPTTRKKRNLNRKKRKQSKFFTAKKRAGHRGYVQSKTRTHKNFQTRTYKSPYKERRQTKRYRDLEEIALRNAQNAFKGSKYPEYGDIITNNYKPGHNKMIKDGLLKSILFTALVWGPHPDLKIDYERFINSEDPNLGLLVTKPDDFAKWNMFKDRSKIDKPKQTNRTQRREQMRKKSSSSKKKKTGNLKRKTPKYSKLQQKQINKKRIIRQKLDHKKLKNSILPSVAYNLYNHTV